MKTSIEKIKTIASTIAIVAFIATIVSIEIVEKQPHLVKNKGFISLK